MGFLTLAGPGRAETRVRGSSFLAYAAPVTSEEAAREALTERQQSHFDATHNCSAWRLREGPSRANDAGEPSGSAGPPILAAIEGAELVDVVVIVTRFFGGTKLGVGGLVRAYGEAAAEALAVAPKRRGIPAVRLRIRYPYGHTAAVMRALERVHTHEIEHGYAAGGEEGEVFVSLAEEREEEVRSLLRDATAAAVSPESLGHRIVYLSGAEAEG